MNSKLVGDNFACRPKKKRKMKNSAGRAEVLELGTGLHVPRHCCGHVSLEICKFLQCSLEVECGLVCRVSLADRGGALLCLAPRRRTRQLRPRLFKQLRCPRAKSANSSAAESSISAWSSSRWHTSSIGLKVSKNCMFRSLAPTSLPLVCDKRKRLAQDPQILAGCTMWYCVDGVESSVCVAWRKIWRDLKAPVKCNMTEDGN